MCVGRAGGLIFTSALSTLCLSITDVYLADLLMHRYK